MTIDEIRKRVAGIEEEAWDAEVAHSNEDDLYIDVLRFIAEGDTEVAPLAREALRVREITFPRWCA